MNRGAQTSAGRRTDLDWKDRAICVGAGFKLFFPGPRSTPKKAKEICRACPVIEECLEYALSWPPAHDYGIFGGTTAAERETIRRKRWRVKNKEAKK